MVPRIALTPLVGQLAMPLAPQVAQNEEKATEGGAAMSNPNTAVSEEEKPR